MRGQLPVSWSRGTLLGLLALTLLGPFNWFLVEFLIASPHGFEMTDEGLYLLAGRDFDGESQWGFPFGWHTAPLYALVGGDVSAFRTVGGTVLSLCGAGLGGATYLALSVNTTIREVFQSRTLFSSFLMFTFLGWLTSFFYYAGLLRSPSYNWVNLAGLFLAGIGGLLIYRSSFATASSKSFAREYSAIFLVAFGLMFSLPAKPSSPALFLGVLFCSWLISIGFRSALWLVLQVVLSSSLVAATLFLTGLWPAGFAQKLLAPFGYPSLTGRGISDAFRDFVAAPVAFVSQLDNWGAVPPVLVAGATGLWILRYVFPNREHLLKKISIALVVIAAQWIFIIQPVLDSGWAVDRWNNPRISVPLALLMVAAGASFVSSLPPGVTNAKLKRARGVFGVATLLGSIPLVFSFGSSHGVVNQSALAGAGFSLAALALVFQSSSRGRQRVSMGFGVTTLISLMVAVTLLNSYHEPYRLQPINSQTQWLQLRDDSSSELRVDAETKRDLQELLQQLELAGYTSGTPTIGFGLETGWFSSVAYAIGADVPSSLIPTIWHYPGDLSLALHLLESDQSNFDWGQAWLIFDRESSPVGLDDTKLGHYLAALGERASLDFPEDYRLVAETTNWRIFSPSKGN